MKVSGVGFSTARVLFTERSQWSTMRTILLNDAGLIWNRLYVPSSMLGTEGKEDSPTT